MMIAPPPPLSHFGYGELRHHVVALEVHVQDSVPHLLGGVLDVPVRVRRLDADVVEQHVHAPERLDRLGDHAAALGHVPDVCPYQQAARPQPVQLGLDGPPSFLVHVRDYDVGAFFRELDRGGHPDAESAARHDHHLAVERTHH